MAIRNYLLNDSKIKSLKPTDKLYQVSDGSTGLLLLISPSGSKRWVYSYTHPTTKKRITKKSFGKYPDISLAEARKIRDEFKSLLAKGVCPFEEKERLEKERKSKEITVEQLSNNWLEWYANKKHLKPETKHKIKRQFERHLFPIFGGWHPSQVKSSDCREKFSKMEDDGLIETLQRVLKNFEKVMIFAKNRDFIEQNLIENITKEFITKPHEHHPTIPPEELPEFLKDLQKSDQKYQTKLLLKLQLLTILRCKEICSLEWIDIDWERGLLLVPAEKMKGGKHEHIVPLSTQALSILEEMKQFTGHRRFIFMSRVNKETHVNKDTPSKAIGRIANGKYKDRLVAHGLRSIASTFLHDVYTTEYYVVEACLSHRDKNSVANAYNRGTYLERRRVLMQAWGDFVSQCEQA